MKIKKLLKVAKDVISAEGRHREGKKKSLKRVIKELKKHEKALKGRLERARDDAERNKIAMKIKLVHAQRKKGLKILKDLEGEA